MTLAERHARLLAYLEMKVEERDWHGVSDAANDLRVLEAQMTSQPDQVIDEALVDMARLRAKAANDFLNATEEST